MQPEEAWEHLRMVQETTKEGCSCVVSPMAVKVLLTQHDQSAKGGEDGRSKQE